MFPIPFNFPFRKKDGSLITIDDAISSGGGGGYTLPTASAETKGGIKIGSGLSMSGEVLNNSNPTPYVLPTASAETKGGVKIGNGLSMDGELLNNANPTPYTLPTASDTTKGGVKVGSGLVIENEVLSVDTSETEVSLISTNVDASSTLYISKHGNTVNLSGYIKLSNNLAVDDRIQVSQGGIPSSMRLSNGWFPCVVTMNDAGVTKFTIATLTVYANGNIFINNNFADMTAKELYVSCSYSLH